MDKITISFERKLDFSNIDKFFVIVWTVGSWQIIDKENIYVRPFVTNVGVYILRDINY